jgi:hypothetical protein
LNAQYIVNKIVHVKEDSKQFKDLSIKLREENTFDHSIGKC